ncbi:hypothetical protein RD792_017478 [Penstemon davidsonii]|uniref:Photolyase/cryptochrome alpha/beta domain-containing protein n=1 Tax=Penstemon davidsonii TaxID=160366 RepID=A0ABR0CNA2_9LAMI|nr:hypothetical protein RD792_017478 [Penstemon davidsonii]
MESKCKSIVWFRRDLRIEDNPALATAARSGCVLPVFIWCPKEEAQYYPGRVSRWWLKQSLIHLEQSFKSLGVEFVLIKAESTLSALLDCVRAIGATNVVYNHLYDPISLARDHNIKQKLTELGISVQSYNAELLYEPWEVYDDNGHAFTTFKAFWDKCLSLEKEPISHLPPWRLTPTVGKVKKCTIEALGLENESEKSSNALLGRGWAPGWSNADKSFSEFVEHHLLNYSKNRFKVGGDSTSLLSPYLHFGELSVRIIFQSIRTKQIVWKDEQNSVGETSANIFLKSIGLREYSRYICFNFPFTHERSLLNNLKFFPWNADQTRFKAWRQGRTGYPLVDAGMRELWATGWIHNRIRVIVSSFFVKFLLLPWQWGMKYFWDTLLDADLESDILGCLSLQFVIQIQGFNFDPDGEYVRQWLPELARMPTEWIHHPWDAPLPVLKSAGVDLGSNYPKPIIDIDLARDQLTQAIMTMQGNTNGRDEVVFENSETSVNLAIPVVVLNETTTCPGSSSHDQKVPSFHNSKNGNKKRLKSIELVEDKLLEGKSSKVNDDVCSTAESSSSKKQMIDDRNSFSVPENYTSMSRDESYLIRDSSELKHIWEGNIDLEDISSKTRATQMQISRNQVIPKDESSSLNQ